MTPRRGLLLASFAVLAAVVVFVDLPDGGRLFDRVLSGELDPGSRWAWFLILAVSTFGSEDLTCVGAGLLVASGRIDLPTALGGCAVGIFVGDVGLYALGRLFAGSALVTRLGVSPRRLAEAREWLRRRGAAAVLLSRFLPGTRLATYLAAGVLGMPALRFCGWFALAVVLWTPILVGGTALLGREFVDRLGSIQVGLLVAGGVVLVVVLLLRLRDVNVRRRWIGRWERLVQWEYWPPWIVYPPVVLEVLWQGWRHRSPTLFTLANPGIPGGGLVGESKSAILGRLPGDAVACFRLLAEGAGERWEAVEAFLAEEGLTLPVVLKPDVGERGTGVAIVRDPGVGRAWLAEHRSAYLVQEYVPGVELGVFWWRWPGAEAGEILSIVEKRLPEVVGDGRRSVEDLVLADPRLRARAGTLLEGPGASPERVPRARERVRLLEVGAHCRGAIFVDGRRLRTPELEAAIDRIATAFDGFCFGRLDLRAPDEDSLRRGVGIRVLEANGVASEAAHVYDPQYGVLDGWRVLRAQWRLAFEIGAAHRERGLEPDTVREVLARVRRGHRGGAPSVGEVPVAGADRR